MACVDVLEHVTDLHEVMADLARVLCSDGLFLFNTINRNPLARLATITVAEELLRLSPRGTHDPAKFIKPAELRTAMEGAGLTPGAFRPWPPWHQPPSRPDLRPAAADSDPLHGHITQTRHFEGT